MSFKRKRLLTVNVNDLLPLTSTATNHTLSLQNPFNASISHILLFLFSQKLQPNNNNNNNNIDGYGIRIGRRRTEALWASMEVCDCRSGPVKIRGFHWGWTWIQTQTAKPLCLGISSSHWYWFPLFLFSNLQILLLLASFLCLIIDIHFSFLISVNSEEAVTSTNRLKAFILAAFYVLLNRFGFSVL